MFTETELQNDQKINLKNDEAQKPIVFSHNRLKISTNSDGLSCHTSGSQLGLLILQLSHDPIK